VPNLQTGKYWDEGAMVVDGCTKVSLGCQNCWSLQMTKRRKPKDILSENGQEWSGFIRYNKDRLFQAVKGKPKVISLWNDLYHEAVPDSVIVAVHDAMAGFMSHKFMVLTKRPARMADIWRRFCVAVWGNVWNGTTCENQEMADLRIPQLLQVPGHKWVSIEPILGPVDIWKSAYQPGWSSEKTDGKGITWFVVGPETGPKRRECDPAWIKSVVDQCTAAGVPVWVKAFPVPAWANIKTGESKDRISHDMNEWPVWARRRELPW